jgi:hypothetical protein
VVPHSFGRCVEHGAGSGERLHDRGRVRIVPGPVGEEVQQRAPAASRILDHAAREPGMDRQQPAQTLDLSLLERRREFDGDRLVIMQRAAHHGYRSPLANRGRGIGVCLFARIWSSRAWTVSLNYWDRGYLLRASLRSPTRPPRIRGDAMIGAKALSFWDARVTAEPRRGALEPS